VIFHEPLLAKVLAGEKTVTRRQVKWEDTGFEVRNRSCKYEVWKTYAVQPVIEDGPGKGRGGKEVARIFVKDVTREMLGGGLDWTISEAEREGFENWPDFVIYWQGLYGSYDPTQLVDRIEFELVPDSRTGS
jgi:hypothetical protein